jgi:hypothetical protein
MPLPGEQVPGHAARQLDQRWRPWRLAPRHEPSMRICVRFMYLNPATSGNLPATSRRCHGLLAKLSQVPSTMRGLARDACEGPPEYGSVQACWRRWRVPSQAGELHPDAAI